MAHRGIVVWLVGLPSSGKSTLARTVAERADEATLLLDGDEVRDAIVPRHGYDETSRDAFYETLARLAALAARQGLLVLVPATAHRAIFRERARTLTDLFIEVFVDTPAEECARRDTKGLYRGAAAGAVPTMPGVGATFEPPAHPASIVRPDDLDPSAAILEAVRAARARA